MSEPRPPIRECGHKRGGVKPFPTTPKPDVIPPSQRKATTKAQGGLTAEAQRPQGSIPDTPDPRPDLTPDALRVDWELDIENEQLEGGDEKLASLIFSSAAGQSRVDNFTPDALRAMADMIYDHANDMDGREFFNRTGLKRQLAKAIPYIGVPQYAVPDGLVDECERVAGIELPTEEQMARAEYEADNDNEDAA